MKYCTQCGAALADSAAFCTQCGAKLDAAPAAEAPTPEAVSAPVTEAAAPAAPKPPKKKSPLLFIIPIAVLVIAIAGFFIYRTVSLNNEIAGLMEEAQEYIDKEKYKQAISRYEAVLELKENHAEAQAGLAAAQTALQIRDTIEEADAALARGNTDEAIKLYHEALSLGSDDPAILAGLTSANLSIARAYLNLGELEEARAVLEKLEVESSDDCYDEYTRLTSVVAFGAQVESVDASAYPTLSITFTFAPGADPYRIDGIDVMESDGAYCKAGVWDAAAEPGRATFTCYTLSADDWGAEKDLAITMHVDGFPIHLTASCQVPAYPSMEFSLFFSESVGENDALRLFADEVSARTDGRVTIDLRQTRSDAADLAYQCAGGGVDLVYAPGDHLYFDNAPRAYLLHETPFLFDGYENARKTVDNFALSWLNEDDPSLRTLAVMGGTFEHFLSCRLVTDILSLGGSIGLLYSPYTYGWGESVLTLVLRDLHYVSLYDFPQDLFYYLQYGECDTVIISTEDLMYCLQQGIAPDYTYLSTANCTFSPNFLFMSNDRWNALPSELQAVIAEAAAQAAQAAWERSEAAEAENIKTLESLGVPILDVDRDSFRSAFAYEIDHLMSNIYNFSPEYNELAAAAAANR